MNQAQAQHQREGSYQGRRAEDILQDEDYFMGVALLSAQRSKDPNTQVGACIVDQKNNENKIVVATGHNKMPDRCDGAFPWARKCDEPDQLKTKYLYVCHAELNAILNSNPRSVKDCSMYVTLFPCNECAKLIIQTEVIYLSDKHKEKNEMIASKRLLDKANVPYRCYAQRKRIEINLYAS